MDAILLDRDGVINRERVDYIKSLYEFEFLPGVLPALRRLATLGVPILVISNQSAIGRGLVSAQTLQEIHQKVCITIQEAGGRIDDFFVCPHRPDEECNCRKPKPGLLHQAAAAYGLNLRKCIFIGDAITDFQVAQVVGCQAILVESGRLGKQLRTLLPPDAEVTIVDHLAAAVELILMELSI